MKNHLGKLRNFGRNAASTQADQVLMHTCAGRVVSAFTYIMMVLCLGMWIAGFILLKDQMFNQPLSENLLTDLTCAMFFGGMVVALIIGALAGNFLRRTFWTLLVKRFK